MFYTDEDEIFNVNFDGTVLVQPGHVEGNPEIGAISFCDNCGKVMPINQPIKTEEEWDEFMKCNGIRTDLDMNTMLRFRFYNPESIDTIIWALNETKKFMLEAIKQK